MSADKTAQPAIANMSQTPYHIPPSCAEIFAPLSAWFAEAASTAHCEIEGKLGTYDASTHTFTSGVPERIFARKLARCVGAGTRWDRVEQETTETMQFTPSGVRGTRHADQSITFVRKVACSHLDFVWGTKAFRISHNVEVPCDMVTEDVAWVRNRRRKSFFYKMWRFDFTMIREGATRAEARSAAVRYEIEIECTDPRPPPSLDHGYLASSLLMKLQDMLRSDDEDDNEDASAPVRIVDERHATNALVQ